jgi:hypothetical protein
MRTGVPEKELLDCEVTVNSVAQAIKLFPTMTLAVPLTL